MEIKKKGGIQAHIFNGSNFEELKEHFPQLEKFDHRGKKEISTTAEGVQFDGYTVGWQTEGFGVPAFTEALPGYYLIDENGKQYILDPDQFKRYFEVL